MLNDNLGELVIKLRADVSKLKKDLNSAKSEVQNAGSSMVSSMKGVAGALAGLGLAKLMKDFGQEAIFAAGMVEQLEVAFRTLLGSEEKAIGLLKDLKAFAATTPFELKELSQGAKQLVAFGFAAEEIIPTMRMLGDITSGTGGNLLDLVQVFGITRNEYKVMTRDLRQFTARGIPVLKALAKEFNVTESEVFDLAEQGKLTYKDLEKVFRDLTEEGGQFFDLMNEQSRTFLGRLSNLKDAMFTYSSEIGKLIITQWGLNEAMGGAVEVLTQMEESARKANEAVLLLARSQALVGLTDDQKLQDLMSEAEVEILLGTGTQAQQALSEYVDDLEAYEEQLLNLKSVQGSMFGPLTQMADGYAKVNQEAIENFKNSREGAKEIGNLSSQITDLTNDLKHGRKTREEFQEHLSNLPVLADKTQEELDELYDQGKISADDWAKSTIEAYKEVAKESKKATTQMNIDLMDLTGSMEKFFINMVNQRMSALAQQSLGDPLNSLFDAAIGGLTGAIGGTFTSGGQIGSSGNSLGATVINNNNFAGVDSINQAQLQNALLQNQHQTNQSFIEMQMRGMD